MFRWLSRRPTLPVKLLPDGLKLYVIGDVHGRLDSLDALHDLILEDVAQSAAERHQVIYLGDYIDRGPHSSGVISRLLDQPLGELPVIYLKGNHEAMMLEFMENPEKGRNWFPVGGGATVASYGLVWRGGEGLPTLAEELASALPADHKEFLDSLRTHFRTGDVLCVHAGIRPGVPLDKQAEADMLWIRQPFLKSNSHYGVLVVHGHTPTSTPDIQENRIGIDTGAYATGVLTGLVLEGAQRYFLSTERDGDE